MKEHVYFCPAPRTVPMLYTETIVIDPPPPPEAQREQPLLLTIGPSATMVFPMLVGSIAGAYGSSTGSGAFLYMGLLTAGCAAVLAVFWGIFSYRYRKADAAEREKQRQESYREYIAGLEEQLQEYNRRNTAVLHHLYPSAAAVAAYDTSCPELWNRNASQKDFLFVRLGLGTCLFQAKIEIPEQHFSVWKDPLAEEPCRLKETYGILQNVPVGICLGEVCRIGLVGGPGKEGAIKLMHLISIQLAAAHSGREVKLAYIWDDETDDGADYTCFRYLPHVWSENREQRFLAGNAQERRDLCYFLAARFRMTEEVDSHMVLFVSDRRLLEDSLISRGIENAEKKNRITILFLAGRESLLPDFVEMIVENAESRRRIHRPGCEEGTNSFLPDCVERTMAIRQGRLLAGIRMEEGGKGRLLPENTDFLELQGCLSVEDLRIGLRWKKDRAGDSLAGILGAGEGGRIRFLDIHEKCHGPHGIIAGATGSGKSVLIQTFLLSLAVNLSPREVTFFLIDYKGGGTADAFLDLPHLAGRISNLSGQQIRRALLAVKSENTRRQRMLAEAGVSHIDRYSELYRSGKVREPMPHLILLVDEFAELKKEEPEFMQELISLSQVGRSLGIHLILAAQKPAGTVSENIWSNARFHICLRVQSTGDSMDMLHHPDAAAITRVGRGYLQVGQDEIYEEFQTAYNENAYAPGAEAIQQTQLVRRNGECRKAEKTAGTTAMNPAAGVVVPGPESDVCPKWASLTGSSIEMQQVTVREAVIQEIGRIAGQEGIEPVRQLWLPELPEVLHASKMETAWEYEADCRMNEDKRETANIRVLMGLSDDPENQRQDPVYVSFPEDGPLAILGESGSGKSTFLQTLLLGILRQGSCLTEKTGREESSSESVHKESHRRGQTRIRIFDFGGGMLTAFREHPAVRVISADMDDGDIREAMEVFRMEMEEKQRYSGEERHPCMTFLFIDGLGNFRSRFYEADEWLNRILREGAAQSTYLVVSAMSPGIAELPSGMRERIRQVFCLEQNDPMRYMEIFHGKKGPVLPETGIPGRGLLLKEGRILEFQTALGTEAENIFARRREIEELCRNSV